MLRGPAAAQTVSTEVPGAAAAVAERWIALVIFRMVFGLMMSRCTSDPP